MKDAIFYEAMFSTINQQNPKVTQSEMRSKRYIPGFKTKAERWAASTYKGIEALREEAVRAIGGNLSKLRKAMSLQRQFDMATVKRVADLAKLLLSNGYITGLSQYEAKRLLAAVKNSAGRNDIEASIQKVMDIMIDNQLKSGETELREIESIKGSKIVLHNVFIYRYVAGKVCRLGISQAY